MSPYSMGTSTVAGTVWAYPNSQYLERHYGFDADYYDNYDVNNYSNNGADNFANNYANNYANCDTNDYANYDEHYYANYGAKIMTLWL
jgi:hypothetical protein